MLLKVASFYQDRLGTNIGRENSTHEKRERGGCVPFVFSYSPYALLGVDVLPFEPPAAAKVCENTKNAIIRIVVCCCWWWCSFLSFLDGRRMMLCQDRLGTDANRALRLYENVLTLF